MKAKNTINENWNQTSSNKVKIFLKMLVIYANNQQVQEKYVM